MQRVLETKISTAALTNLFLDWSQSFLSENFKNYRYDDNIKYFNINF